MKAGDHWQARVAPLLRWRTMTVSAMLPYTARAALNAASEVVGLAARGNKQNSTVNLLFMTFAMD